MTNVWHNRRMAAQSSKNNTELWRLDSNKATLHTPQLTASIDLLNPHVGISQLALLGNPIRGFVLGINPSNEATTSKLESKLELSDVFVRGSDLVAQYTVANEQPFSLQVYWRATVGGHGALLLDTILSLQTPLLESFPSISTETKLPIATAWLLPEEASTATEIAIPDNHAADRTEGILLRPSQGDWSYAEATHSNDLGECRLERCEDKSLLMQRQLGGQFLEKGVIRSLRVRGVFLPRADDLECAAKHFATFKTAEPPLTV